MSDAKEQIESVGAKADQAGAKGGIGVLPLVLIVLGTVVIVLGAVGGGLYWLSRSGRLPIPGAAAPVAPVATKK